MDLTVKSPLTIFMSTPYGTFRPISHVENSVEVVESSVFTGPPKFPFLSLPICFRTFSKQTVHQKNYPNLGPPFPLRPASGRSPGPPLPRRPPPGPRQGKVRSPPVPPVAKLPPAPLPLLSKWNPLRWASILVFRWPGPAFAYSRSIRWAITRAAFTPEAPAWARPRVTPAPSPTAKKPGNAVSSSRESWIRAE